FPLQEGHTLFCGSPPDSRCTLKSLSASRASFYTTNSSGGNLRLLFDFYKALHVKQFSSATPVDFPRNLTAILARMSCKLTINRQYDFSLTAAQSLKDKHRIVFLNLVGKGFSVDHNGVVDAQLHMPAQGAMFIQHIIGKAGGLLVDGEQNLGDRAGRYPEGAVLQLWEEPVEVRCHFNCGHSAEP